MVLIAVLIASRAALAAASPTSARVHSLARRLLGQADFAFGGGSNRFCRNSLLCNSRAQTAQTLTTLQAQASIGLAASGGGPATTFGATQSAQRGAIAAANGNIPYAANQVAFDEALNPGSAYGLYNPFNGR